MIGALSGYGMMSSNGAADLLADHVTGRAAPALRAGLPPRAATTIPPTARCSTTWGDSGQL